MIRMPRFRWATAVLAMGVLAVAACDDDDDDGGPTNEGTLEVTVTATGTPADPDGFTVLLDGTQMGAVVPATGGVRTQDLEPGDYEVELDNLADNCTVDGDNPRTVTIEDDETTEVTFAVTCEAATGGTVSVTTTTTGTNPDADGFQVSVNGGTPQTVTDAAAVEFTDVAAGDAVVLLTGIQGNCDVTGDNPLTVAVTAGASAPAAFAVSCAANAGAADVTVVTTGTNVPAGPFNITVEGIATPFDVDPNGTLRVGGLTPGDVDFTLAGHPGTCTVTEGAAQTITIVDQQSAEVTYTLTCT